MSATAVLIPIHPGDCDSLMTTVQFNTTVSTCQVSAHSKFKTMVQDSVDTHPSPKFSLPNISVR